jgi:type IV secretion system protein VirD4
MRAREDGEPRILFMLDEFAALGHLKIIETVWALVRGYGIQIMPVLQDLNQLKSLYEQRWETFLGNAGAAVFFAPNDATTAAWLETRLGNTTRMVTTASTSDSTNTGENTGEGGSSGPSGGSSSSNVGRSSGRSNSSSSNTAPVKVPLMTARRLHGLKPGELWLVMAGKADAAKVFAPHYFNIGDRTERARVNPYFQPVPRRLALPAGGG